MEKDKSKLVLIQKNLSNKNKITIIIKKIKKRKYLLKQSNISDFTDKLIELKSVKYLPCNILLVISLKDILESEENEKSSRSSKSISFIIESILFSSSF